MKALKRSIDTVQKNLNVKVEDEKRKSQSPRKEEVNPQPEIKVLGGPNTVSGHASSEAAETKFR